MPKITIIKIIHFTIDFLLAGFYYVNDLQNSHFTSACKYAFQKAIFPHNWSKKVLIQSILDKDDINRGTTLFR